MKRISPKAIRLWRIREYINAGVWLLIAAAIGIAQIFLDFIPWWIFLIPLAVAIYIIIVHAWIIPNSVISTSDIKCLRMKYASTAASGLNLK